MYKTRTFLPNRTLHALNCNISLARPMLKRQMQIGHS